MNVLTKGTYTVSITTLLEGGSNDTVGLCKEDLARLGWRVGDRVLITCIGRSLAQLIAVDKCPQGSLLLSPLLSDRIGAGERADVHLDAVDVHVAKRLVLAPLVTRRKTEAAEKKNTVGHCFHGNPFTAWYRQYKSKEKAENRREVLAPNLDDFIGLCALAGCVFPLDSGDVECFRVVETVPEGAVIINAQTEIEIIDPDDSGMSYRDIGGLSTEVARIREMVELPLSRPDLFEQLGVNAPRGVLLYGPPGCGKTLIARAVSQQTGAVFLSINGPEIIRQHYGESEELLRSVFEEAHKYPAAILFIDEIDSLAPNRETVLGDVEKRVVGQLLALMDGVNARGNIVVMAATNRPNSLDPALRRPGRFDREISINPPNKAGRLEILKVHTRLTPLAVDVELEKIAAITHGFLGADLAALCREAAMVCARNAITLEEASQSHNTRASLFVTMDAFQKALTDFKLSTLRELCSDVAEISWDDIGGLAEQKQMLKESLEWPLTYRNRFYSSGAHPPKGVLLTGGSGTGKTLLAQAVGYSTEDNFITAKGPELLSKWVGDSERGIREVFRRARQSAPSIIFFDELDAITPARGQGGGDGQLGDRMVGQFLLELDALDADAGVVVLAATNRPDLIDKALLRPGRFDLIIDLPSLDTEARQAIFHVHCRQALLATDVDFIVLSNESDGMTGAEIAAICQHAKMLAISESISREPGIDYQPFLIEMRHFLSALTRVERNWKSLGV